jgi:long-chain acyl-CoA synthetase
VIEVAIGTALRTGVMQLNAAQVKKFFLLDRELSTQEGELTQTLKIKRMAVNERFATQFDRLYDRPWGSTACSRASTNAPRRR